MFSESVVVNRKKKGSRRPIVPPSNPPKYSSRRPSGCKLQKVKWCMDCKLKDCGYSG
jgi:hypothetical protein